MMFAILCLILSITVNVRAQMEGFIVGGAFARINRYPHSAFLFLTCVERNGRRFNWVCGSSLLNQLILLTAAHCLYPCNYNTRISVNMGDENRKNGVVRTGNGFIIHEDYNDYTYSADIALIKLLHPVQLSPKIKRVAIMSNPPYSEQAYLAGWGLTNEYTKQQGIYLKEVDQTIWETRYCENLVGPLPGGTICGRSKKQSDFATDGDSGYGLMVRGYIQVGLVSYKVPTIANNLIFYTDVGYFYDWIKFNAARLYCTK